LKAEEFAATKIRRGDPRLRCWSKCLVLGNPLIMKEMAKHVPDAGSYAPVTVLVDELADGVIFHMTGWPDS
jgi:hypothetical protein